jgi:hypothetical protein
LSFMCVVFSNTKANRSCSFTLAPASIASHGPHMHIAPRCTLTILQFHFTV